MADMADHNLAGGQFADVNLDFYGADPMAYLRHRMESLLLFIGKQSEVRALLVDGVTYEKITYRDDGEDPEPDPEALEHYATTESVVLLHHATEALLRLFFSHEHWPECPWLEMARLRRPGAFPERLKTLLKSEDADQEQRIDAVFLGSVSPTDFVPPPNAEEWKKAGDGARLLLHLCAEQLLSDGAMYNAAKHGLGVKPGTSSLKFGSDEKPFPLDIGATGPSLMYVERTKQTDRQPPRWQRGITWVHPSEHLTRVFLVLRLMESLWSVARARYLGDTSSVSIKPVFPKEVEASIFYRPESPYTITGFGLPLLYYADDPSAPVTGVT
jgi:hypothetical protein